MELIKQVFGTTAYGNEVTAYHSDLSLPSGWTYFISGLNGHQMEGVFILHELQEWIKEDLLIDLPLIIVPTLNMDGHLNHTVTNGHGEDLLFSFPQSTHRPISLSIPGHTRHILQKERQGHKRTLEPEVLALQSLFEKYPPGLLIHFSTVERDSTPFMVSQGEDAHSIGEFLSHCNHYPCFDDKQREIYAGSLEGFVYDYYLAQTLSIILPKASPLKTFHRVWLESAMGFKQLLSRQNF